MVDVAALVAQGLGLHQEGRLREAALLYRQVLDRHPRHAEANHLLGLVEHQSGNREKALQHLSVAVAAAPDEASYLSNLGLVLQGLGRLEEAGANYRRALALDPGVAAIHNNLGVVLLATGAPDEARDSFAKAVALEAGYAEAHANLGLALQQLGDLEGATAALGKATALRPGYARAQAALGQVLGRLGRYTEAVESLRAALASNPLDPVLQNNLGITLREAGDLQGALESFGKAVSYRPNYADAHVNLGKLQRDVGQLEQAIASYRSALAIRPQDVATHVALAGTLQQADRYDEAAETLRRICELEPGNGAARAEYWRTLGHGCSWHGIEALRDDMRDFVRGFDPASGERAGTPFPLLGLLDEPELHLKAASDYAAGLLRRVKEAKAPEIQRRNTRPEAGKLRLAYVSSDFHDHATAYLIAELFEQHDRERFEVHGISFGPREDSAMRRRLVSSFTDFHDLRGANARDIARAIANLGADIAIDLKGYTQGAGSSIFVYRPAPIQVQYLGYPGTMGADFIDYVIADKVVIPADEQRHYREQIAYLPHSYQVNDRSRALPAQVPSRAECGLPQTGVVFASFNASYKITPEIFAVWLRLLARVEGSVLWLFRGNSWATENLRSAATAGGIDPERLIFAERLPLDLHLARIANADLFLDTLPYNAHTTASDALWVGLPVLTVAGRSFAGRVAASLLKAAEMPELITGSLEDYEALALALALAPGRLAELSARLKARRLAVPLFDTPRFARHLEAAFETMWQRHRTGLPPATFEVAPD